MSTYPADFRPPIPDRQFSVTSSDGTRLAVQVYGDGAGRRTVVLSHGWTLAAVFWTRVVNRLANDFRVVTFDQRGHGGSDVVGPGNHTLEALSEDLAAVLGATVPAGEKAVYAGHSMGGMALVAAATRRPEAVRDHVGAALLVSTGMDQLLERAGVLPARRVKGSPTGELRVAGRTRHGLTRFGLTDPRSLHLAPRPVAHRILQFITMSRTATAAERAFCGDVVLSCPTVTWVGFAHMLAALDLSVDLRSLDVPTLVLAGSRDRLTPPWHSHRMAAALPQSLGLEIAPDAGHMTPATEPDRVAAAVRRLAADRPATDRPAAPTAAALVTPSGGGA